MSEPHTDLPQTCLPTWEVTELPEPKPLGLRNLAGFIIWSSNSRIRHSLKPNQASRIYYSILAAYVLWSFISATIFLMFGDAPKLMVLVIANLNNVALGGTACHVLYINRTFLPQPLRPRWYNQLGIIACGVFYCGIALLVFCAKILPLITD